MNRCTKPHDEGALAQTAGMSSTPKAIATCIKCNEADGGTGGPLSESAAPSGHRKAAERGLGPGKAKQEGRPTFDIRGYGRERRVGPRNAEKQPN